MKNKIKKLTLAQLKRLSGGMQSANSCGTQASAARVIKGKIKPPVRPPVKPVKLPLKKK